MENFLQYIAGAIGLSVGGVLGYLCRSVIENRLATERMRENIKITEFNRAAAKLRASFAPLKATIKQSRDIGNGHVRRYFDETTILNAAEIEEFRPFVSDSAGYQKAWDDYQETIDGEQSDVWWSSCMYPPPEGEEPLQFSEVITQKIESILHHAQPK